MSKQDEGLKYQHLELEGFKNIDRKILEIGGRSFFIVGPNGSGKSSIMQGMLAPLSSAKDIPDEPIKEGEERARVSIVLAGIVGGEPKKYTLDMVFTPGNKRGKIYIYNEAGEEVKTAPATFIKSLVGAIASDPTEWLRESNEKKLTMLKQLTGCELDINKINEAIKEKKASKKAKKDRIEEVEAILKNHNYSQDEIDKYSTPIPVEPIQQELTQISKAIEAYSDVEKKMKSFKDGIENSEKTIADTRKSVEDKKRATAAEIERLKALIAAEGGKLESFIKSAEERITLSFADIEKNKSNLVKGDAWLASKTKPSAEEINKRFNDAVAHNVHHDKIMRHAGEQREMLKAKEELGKIETDIKDLEKRRGDLIAKSQLPIEGLSFSDDDIFIDGLPLNNLQINTARLWDIGVDIALALNPKLKAIFIQDGSLLDKEGQRNIVKKIESKGCMAIIEVVREGELGIVYAEEELK